jgi:hypothetical protein
MEENSSATIFMYLTAEHTGSLHGLRDDGGSIAPFD